MITKTRKTKETNITVSLKLYGQGKSNIHSGIGFLDHMLESFAKHALIDLDVTCKGDTHIDDHHSTEDIAIVIGSILEEAIYPASGIERFGNATVVMDESCVSSDIDLSHRPYLVYELPVEGKVGNYDTELVEEFFRALVFNAKITAHIITKRGRNKHHLIEAAFKALAISLRRAVAINERVGIPSTKDML